MPADRRTDTASTIRTLGALGAVGIAFVLAVVIGFFVGYGLDRLTGLTPLFTIVFFFFGLAAGIMNVVRAASGIGAGPKPPPRNPLA
jgi:F0F1-type ATP synthase assembly protein I